MPDHAAETDEGQHQGPHEDDLQDGAVGRVPRGPEGVVLGPVAHAEEGGAQVDAHQAEGDAEALPLHAHEPEDGGMEGQDAQSYEADEALAEVHQPPGPGVGQVRIARAHLLAHQDARGVGEAGEEADHQALQGAEDGDGGDGLLRLAAQDDVDDHVAHADEQLVQDDGEALAEIFLHQLPVPAEVAAEGGEIGVGAALCQQHHHADAHPLGDHRGQGRAPHAHGGEAQMPEDQHIVEAHVDKDGDDGAIEGDAHPLRAAQQGRHGHAQHHEGIVEAHDAQILHAYLLQGLFIRIQAHHRPRAEGGQAAENDGHGHHAAEGQAVGTVDAVVVLGPPVLGDEEHAPADEAPVAAEHQGGELGAEAHGPQLGLAQGGDHHGVHHAAGGGQQVLQSHRNGDHGDPAQEIPPVEAL